MSKKILILGSNSILSKCLIGSFSSECAIDVAYSGEKSGIEKNKNVNTISLVELNPKKDYDVIIIVSSFIPEKSEQNNEKLFDVNVKLVGRIIKWFPKSKIIYCSSVSVFAPNNQGINEKSTVSPVNEYALSKLWAEKIIQRNAKSYCILRISSLIGKEMKENTFLPMIINKALEIKKITLFGDGERKQNYIDAEQVAKLILACMDYRKNNVFLAVNNYSYSNKEVAELVQKQTNCEIEYAGIDESISAIYDNSYTKQELNFTLNKTIEQSVKEIIEWKQKTF